MKYFSEMTRLPMGMEECRQSMKNFMKIPLNYIIENEKEFRELIYFLGIGFAETGLDEFTKNDEPFVTQFADWLDSIYAELHKAGIPDVSPADDFRLTKKDVDKILSEWEE